MKVDNKFIKKYNKYIRDTLKKRKVDSEMFEETLQEVYYNCKLLEDDYDAEKGKVTTWLNLVIRFTLDRMNRSTDIMDRNPLSLDAVYKNKDGDKVTLYDSLTEHNKFEIEEDRYYLNNTPEVHFYLDQLPEIQRKVLELKLILGYSHEEVADTLKISESAAQKNYRRGVQTMKELVTGDDTEILHHKLKGVHQQAIQTNDESGVDVWNDWSYRHENAYPGKVKQYTKQEIEQYNRGIK